MSDEKEPATGGETGKTEAIPQTLPIRWNDFVKIEWLAADGTVNATDTCRRSRAELLKFLAEKVSKDKIKLEAPVCLYEEGVEVDPKTGTEGTSIKRVIAQGPLNTVAITLLPQTLHPIQVMREYQQMCEFMAVRSSLKGIMITAVFGDAEQSGFGYLSSASTVTEADIITLAEAAANQVQMLKTNTKKDNPKLEFPSDEPTSKIIVPKRFRK